MIALYCRLSVADGERGGESDSILNQRMILADFVSSRDDLRGEEHRFFVDDGISGTHADNRPALQEMLRCCREGRVSAVVVKDLSRLSRDGIYCVRLVEDELPAMGVRVIAVADNYDSRRDHGSMQAGTELGFKAIMNSWYSKDLSRKVTQSVRSEHARGMNLHTYPFGYRRGEERHSCVVDEEGARVVRRIFQLAAQGLAQREVARRLNEEGCVTPYNLRASRSRSGKMPPKPNSRWTGTMVKGIVRNPHYKGTLVLGKQTRVEIATWRTRPTTEEERHVFEGAHEAIVTPEEWEAAQASMVDYRCGGEMEPLNHLFSGLIFCPRCGRAVPYRTCDGPAPRYVAYCGCFESPPSISLDDLSRAVWRVVRAHVDVLLGLSGALAAAEAQRGDRERLARRLEAVPARKLRAYEEYRAGRANREAFGRRKAELDSEESGLRLQMERIERALERAAPARVEAERAVELARRIGHGGMTREALEAFVERVELLGDDEVHVTLRYGDLADGLA